MADIDFCYRTEGGVAVTHNWRSINGAPYHCERCGKGMPILAVPAPCDGCAALRASLRDAEAERDAAEVATCDHGMILHDCLLFLESADWHLGVHRTRTPWDDGLRDVIVTLRRSELGEAQDGPDKQEVTRISENALTLLHAQRNAAIARAEAAERDRAALSARVEALAKEWEDEAERRRRDSHTVRKSPAEAQALRLGASFEQNHAKRLRALLPRPRSEETPAADGDPHIACVPGDACAECEAEETPAAPAMEAPWYAEDGSMVMLPAEEVERRRRLAAKVIGAARALSAAADLWVVAGTEAPTMYDVPPESMRVLRDALQALDAASPAAPNSGSEGGPDAS